MKMLYFLILFWIFFPFNVFANDTFLSLKKNKVNVRYGPGFEYPIKYIYKKINLPIKQIDKKENFRRIIDLKNNSGWIHCSYKSPSDNRKSTLRAFRNDQGKTQYEEYKPE